MPQNLAGGLPVPLAPVQLLRRGDSTAGSSYFAAYIRQEIFDRQGYDTFMNLLAVYAENDPRVLSDSDESIERRAQIFEEYANGGLQQIQDELKGAVDCLESIMLMISAQQRPQAKDLGAFDLSKLVSE